MCNDLDATIALLGSKGVERIGPISQQTWGRVTSVGLPDGSEKWAVPADPPATTDTDAATVNLGPVGGDRRGARAAKGGHHEVRVVLRVGHRT